MHLRKVCPQCIIRGQFMGVNKPSRLNAYRYHCAEGLALQCFSLKFMNSVEWWQSSFQQLLGSSCGSVGCIKNYQDIADFTPEMTYCCKFKRLETG